MTEVIAEIGLAHDGSLNLAHAYIDMVADAGVQWVKFQCHHPAEGTPSEPWARQWSRYVGETRADYWLRTGFTREQYQRLYMHAQERGLMFACSVFSPEAVELLDGWVDAWKIPSGQVNNMALFKAMGYGCYGCEPVWVSAGMSNDPDNWIWNADVVFHCVSQYPTPLDKTGWDRLTDFIIEYGETHVGLSDHSGTIWPGLQAAAEGVALVEVHVTMDKRTGLPDATSSLDMGELKLLCDGIKAMQAVRESGGWERPENAHLYEPKEVEPGVWKKTG